MLGVSSLDNFTTSFESGDKRYFSGSICSSNSESVGGVDGGGDDFDKDLVRPGLGNIEVSIYWDGSEGLDNEGFLG